MEDKYQGKENKVTTSASENGVQEEEEYEEEAGEEEEGEDEEEEYEYQANEKKPIHGPVGIAPGLFEESYRYKVVRYRFPEEPVPSIEEQLAARENTEYRMLIAYRLPHAPSQTMTIETITKFPNNMNK
jgi:cobalamin biosynthesis protein CobT